MKEWVQMSRLMRISCSRILRKMISAPWQDSNPGDLNLPITSPLRHHRAMHNWSTTAGLWEMPCTYVNHAANVKQVKVDESAMLTWAATGPIARCGSSTRSTSLLLLPWSQRYKQTMIKITKTTQIVKIVNYTSSWLTYINFMKLYLTNLRNKKEGIK